MSIVLLKDLNCAVARAAEEGDGLECRTTEGWLDQPVCVEM